MRNASGRGRKQEDGRRRAEKQTAAWLSWGDKMAAVARRRLLGLGGSFFFLLFALAGPQVAWAEGEPAPDSLSEAFAPALGNTASCQRTCQSTYPLHTYPKEEELYACQRGCRLFSVCQFADDGLDLNQTKLECDSACTEAYTFQSDEQYACRLGCQNQLPYAELRREQLMSLMPRMHLLFPLTLVRSFWSDMMESAHSFISSSWTFYLQADDGKILIFQSKPEVQYVQSPAQETPDLKESLNKLSRLQQVDSQKQKAFFDEDETDSFFKCISVNSGWILTTTLLLSVLVLLWICCATVTTAVEQYVPSEKLSIYGDLEYVNEQKLNRYPTSALMVVKCKDDEEEAGPLPPKVDLIQSAI